MKRNLARLLAAAAFATSVTAVGTLAAAPASAAACGTTFAGFDGTMTQTYTNCWGNAWVSPAYTTSGGAMTFFPGECRLARGGAAVSWNHPYTLPGAGYTTVFCTDFPIVSFTYYYGRTGRSAG